MKLPIKKTGELIFLLFLFSCSDKSVHQLKDDSYYYQLSGLEESELLKKYDRLKSNIERKRKSLSRDDNSARTKTHDYLIAVLTDSVFHFWYDTDWDFNGITEKPKQGSIACGYFVTTTLKHIGIKLERVKIAQQAASKIIRTLCDKSSIKTFSNKNFKGLKSHLKNSKDGLYIIGLDNHVGFIHKKDTSIVMIHSSVGTGIVCRERIDDCNPILNSGMHMIGNLSDNKVLLDKWLRNEKMNLVE